MPRILVIEDTHPVRDAICRVLVDAGYEVEGASTGAAGLAVWRAKGADLILADLQMPRSDGIEVVLGLRILVPTLPIIALTGEAPFRELDLLAHSDRLGKIDILHKPFTVSELLSAVSRALKR
jgi:DNA-binding response OmpR family regulator